jgi:transposase-like protein
MTAYTDDQRAEAVDLYLQHGLADTHHRTGIPRATLRLWLQKAGHDPADVAVHTGQKTQAANQATRERWETLRLTMADRSGDIASKLLEIVADNLDELKPRNAGDAKHLATAAAILIDKAQLLTGGATSRPEAPWDPERVKAYAVEEGEKVRPIRAVA